MSVLGFIELRYAHSNFQVRGIASGVTDVGQPLAGSEYAFLVPVDLARTKWHCPNDVGDCKSLWWSSLRTQGRRRPRTLLPHESPQAEFCRQVILVFRFDRSVYVSSELQAQCIRFLPPPSLRLQTNSQAEERGGTARRALPRK